MEPLSSNTPASATRTPAVAVVMPCYNAAAYIEEALESLMEQTWRDFEIVVCDDCSTDGTVAKVRAFMDASAGRLPHALKLVECSSNSGGPYWPRRRAIEAASAPLVAPLDADDAVEPEYLADLMARKATTGADIVYPVMYRWDGADTRERQTPAADFDMERVWRGEELVEYTLDGWRIGAGGGLLERWVYETCFDLYPPAESAFADEVLTRQLLIAAWKVALCETPYLYRVNPESVTHRITPRMFDFLENDRALVSLAHSRFGEDHPAYIRAVKQLYNGYFRALSMLRRHGHTLSAAQRAGVMRRLADQRGLMDWKVLSGRSSLHTRIMARMEPESAMKVYPVYEKLRKLAGH